MKKYISLIVTLFVCVSLAGCATDNLNAPCPNFGATCSKVPVNSWNTNS